MDLPRDGRFLLNVLLVERNFDVGPGFGMISPKRRFERGIWVGKSMKRWSIVWHLQQRKIRKRNTSVRSGATIVGRRDTILRNVLRKRM